MNHDKRNEISCNENCREKFFFSYGLSEGTALNQFGGICGMGCAYSKEKQRGPECRECSQTIAEIYLDDINKYKNNIITAAKEKCFDAALLAAFISRQTRGGSELNGSDGWKPCHNSQQQCFGIMHMPECKFWALIIDDLFGTIF